MAAVYSGSCFSSFTLLLHMNISTGTLNGIILYANLMNTYKQRPIFPSTKSESKFFDYIFIMDELGLRNF